MRVWTDGRLLESPDVPVISVLDHGLVVGDGVFETLQVQRDEPFALTRHLERLVRSAEGLGIGKPDLGAVREGVAAALDAHGIAFGRLRITVTSGVGPLGSPRGHAPQTVVVAAEAIDQPPAVSRVVTVPWVRNERGAISGLKTTSYAENALMIEHAHARGAAEAIMANTVGDLCEGTGANIMYVLDGQLVTPTLASGCLAGVTRALVLEWCADELDVVERDAPLSVLQDADEVILVGTTRDVQAISQVDDQVYEAPGPITRAAQQIWAREAARGMDP